MYSLAALDLVNVGPFSEAHMDFRREDEGTEVAPVALITGENGTGKSILIDAIREAFGRDFTGSRLPREIFRGNEPGSIALAVFHDGWTQELRVVGHGDGRRELMTRDVRHPPGAAIGQPWGNLALPGVMHWIVDYWQSSLDTTGYELAALTGPKHEEFLQGALRGGHRNADTTAFICHLDYLRDSQDPEERGYGQLLFDAMTEIAEASLLGGRFSHVARSRLEPMFEQRGEIIGIGKLSAGSQYLIQRMLGLLARVYSRRVWAEQRGDATGDASRLLETPGLLLIDEAENHLHPKWQKRLLPTVRRLFPNLQIIATTHSPFVLAAVPDARVFVCRAEGARCTVADVSDSYANQPIDDILLSPAFAETQPFSQEISELLDERRQAIEREDEPARARIEKELLERNREYFGYLEIDALLERMRDGAGRS